MKRRKRHSERLEHHGGSWKIAYADFITTMMAFFLLMWLLNITTEEQRKGISDYFLGITSQIEPPKFLEEIKSTPPMLDAEHESASENVNEKDETEKNQGLQANTFTGTSLSISTQKQEEQIFKSVESHLFNVVRNSSELRELAGHLIIEQTREGLKIQIIDQDNRQLFAPGSAEMMAHTKKLLHVVGEAIKKLPNPITLDGHTDATPFMRDKKYTNWELSFDRANAFRYALTDMGIPSSRFRAISGKESNEPLLKGDLVSAKNRRVSIMILRNAS